LQVTETELKIVGSYLKWVYSAVHTHPIAGHERRKEVRNGKPENTEGVNIQLLCSLKAGEGTREHGKYK
jgi:hypothetical protein